MQEAADAVEKQKAWFSDVQKKVSEFVRKLTSASEVAMTNQPVIDRLSSLQVRYSKQHAKDMSALERRQRKTMEQSTARIKAMKLAKSHSHVEQSGDNWQVYDDYINPSSN